jgi:uncharacterized membrane protein
MTGLGILPGESLSWGTAVSDNGRVVVGFNSSGYWDDVPFMWTSSGGMVSLGFLPGGDDGQALGVSADGTVIVGYCRPGTLPASSIEGFLWTASSGMVGIGALPGGSVPFSRFSRSVK